MAFDTSDFDYEKPLGTFSADGEMAKAIDCLGGSGVSIISFIFIDFLFLLFKNDEHFSNFDNCRMQ